MVARNSPERRFKRLLVALEAGVSEAVLLEEAARLAAGLEAELVGLLIESADMIEASGLPMTRLVPSQARQSTELTADMMRRAIRIWNEGVRQALAMTAKRWNVPWSARPAEWPLLSLAAPEAEALDFVLYEASSAHKGVTEKLLASRACRSIFLIRRRVRAGEPIVLLFEGSEEALVLAGALARVYGAPLRIIPIAGTEASATERKERLLALQAQEQPQAGVVVLEPLEPNELSLALARRPPAILIVERTSPLAAGLGDLAKMASSALLVIV
jgi:hypothetical protein